jgi:isochorismate hydrolase
MTDFILLTPQIGADTMPTRVDLPKDIVKQSLEAVRAVRLRNIKAARNPLIKTALEDEANTLWMAMNSLTETE